AHPFGDEEVVVRGDGVGGVVLSGGAASGVDVVKVVVVDGAVDGGSGGWWRWCGDDVDGCRRLRCVADIWVGRTFRWWDGAE
ncbi:hypothetical protein Tco_1331384, partial [Tanacetum coccineum]